MNDGDGSGAGAAGCLLPAIAPGRPPRGVCLRLAYEGTAFSGWQAQPGRRTVQGTLAAAIRTVSGEEVRPRATSRTDAGVHALDQVAAFTSSSGIEPASWARALDANLPADMGVVAACGVPPGFDPLAVAASKLYRYRIHDGPGRPVFNRSMVWRWRGRLAVERMQEAAHHLVGEHDFSSFEKTPSTRTSKVRTIHRLSIRRPDPGPDGRAGTGPARAGGAGGIEAIAASGGDGSDEVWIEVEGNGFLHNMVRIIAGSLVMVGAGRRPATWLAAALAARSRPAAGPTAPPQGLLLAVTTLRPDPWHGFPTSSPP